MSRLLFPKVMHSKAKHLCHTDKTKSSMSFHRKTRWMAHSARPKKGEKDYDRRDDSDLIYSF